MITYLHRHGRVSIAAAALLLLAALALWRLGQTGPTALAETAPDSAHLPAVFKPENTPTPQPTPTAAPTATPTPGPTATPRPTPIPGGPNKLVNGSFEDGWTDIYSPIDNQLKQQPTGWTLTWLDIGERLYDETDPKWVAGGLPEALHKPWWTLPEDERPGGANALILEGDYTYKMFNRGAAFGSELSQVVENLPVGRYRLTVPVQLHWQEKLDPGGVGWDHDTAQSGAWVIVNGQKLGRWANALEMGDRQWYYHVVEFELSETADVEVLLRFKSRYALKDFFTDAVRLEAAGAPSP